jgi:preprotein translocase subunit SecF
MQFFKDNINFDFMSKRKVFGVFSAVVVILSITLAFVIGPKFGIDFMGGTEIQVRFTGNVDAGAIRGTLKGLGFPIAEVVSIGSDNTEYLIRLQAVSPISAEQSAAAEKAFKGAFKDVEVKRFEFSPGGDKLTLRLTKEVPLADIEKTVKAAGLEPAAALDAEDKIQKEAEAKAEEGEAGEKQQVETSKKCEGVTCTWPYQDMFVFEVSLKGVSERIVDGLRATSFGKDAQKQRSEWVGPKVGKQLREAGIWSIVYALLFIMLYIAVRFDLRFAPGAVVALIHDVFITVGIFTVARVEFTLATVAALLTIVGYSLNDTIVVFDRIRENMAKMKERKLSSVINISINQTLSRTVLTSLTTLFVVVALLTIGWNTNVRDFAFALLIGVIVGTYSSIFIASPIVVWLDNRFFKKNE